MALAIDASTPAVATQGSATTATITTASFTPPAGALLLILWSGNTAGGFNPTTPTVTDNLGAHLTYTLLDWQSRANAPTVDGQAASWWATVGTSAAMTVTVTTGTSQNNKEAELQVIVITGQAASPIGAHGKSGSTSAASIAQTYTAAATSGWGFIGVCDWSALGVETAGTGCTAISAGDVGIGQISYGNLRRTTADDSNGVSNTLNVTVPGTSTALSWVYAEVLPAAGGAAGTLPVDPTISQAAPQRTPGQVYVTRSTADPTAPPAGPVPLPVDGPAGIPPRVAGTTFVAAPRAEPYLDPPGWRQPAAAAYVAPRTGSALIVATRTDPAAVVDLPPAPLVDTVRTPTPIVVGTATITRSTADPDFPPVPVVELSRATPPATLAGTATMARPTADSAAVIDFPPVELVQLARAALPPALAGTATMTRPTADPPAVADFPPIPIVETSRPNGGPPMPGSIAITRPAADPTTPTQPAPVVLIVRTATWPTVAPTAVVDRSTADPTPDARQPIAIATIGMPAETLGWAILTRSVAPPPQPTITPATIEMPTPMPIRIGTAAVGVPRTDPPPAYVPIMVGLDGSARAGTIEGNTPSPASLDGPTTLGTVDGSTVQPGALDGRTTITGGIS